MSSIQTLSIQAALLAAGQNLELPVDLIDCTDPPLAGGTGYPTGGAAYGVVMLGVRRGSPGRVVDIRVTTTDLTATYTAIIDGNSVAYNAAVAAPADVTELVTEWAADITADATVGSAGSAVKTTASAVDSTGSGTVDTVRITGLTPDSWSFTATDTGTAALAVTLDPEGCTLTVYEERSGIASLATRLDATSEAGALSSFQAWHVMQGATGDATLTVADGQGRSVGVLVNGTTQVYPYITSITGVTGDGSGTVGSVTYTRRDPEAVVVYGRVT